MTWQKGLKRHPDFELPYQLFTPGPEAPRPLPFVLWLHGSGEAGQDNEAQMYSGTGCGPDFFSSTKVQQAHPHYILAPQTTESVRWVGDSLAEFDLDNCGETTAMKALRALLAEVLSECEIDRERIYLSGLSRGGQGTWYMALSDPGFFAAILPFCGSGSPRHAGLLKDLAIWTCHGDADQITPVEYTRNMVRELRRTRDVSPELRYTEVPGGLHHDGWERVFHDTGLADWLFSWRRIAGKPSSKV